MSGDFARRSTVSDRVQNMMRLVNDDILPDSKHPSNLQNADNTSPDQNLTSPNKTSKQATYSDKSHIALVDDNYSSPLFMMSQIFQTFCETQNTLTSNHFISLAETISTLNEAFKFTTTQTEAISQQKVDTLYCQELMPSSREPSPDFLDFDSDDSVKDKDYRPTDDDYRSDDVDTIVQEVRVTKKVPKKKKNPSNKTEEELFPTKIPISMRRHSAVIDLKDDLHVPSLNSRKRRLTIDSTPQVDSTPCTTTSVIHETRNAGENVDAPNMKRKKYSTTLDQRKAQKQRETLIKNKVKPGCVTDKCLKKCTNHFTNDEREELNLQFWKMSRSEKRLFVRSNYTVAIPKRKYTNEPKRNPKRCFTLQKKDGTLVVVCKIFFLTTLGFKKTNDKILWSSLDENNDTDKRGKHQKTQKIDRDLITKHIETFEPSAPHYRREHAPHRRYLSSEINITFMYKDFCSKHPEQKIGYEVYRTHLKSLNISFARLGNEECELCESYRLHTLETNHDVRKQNVPDCSVCLKWDTHHRRYQKARQLYEFHKSLVQNEEQIYFSSDLEKVIMLPRLETFKAVIFCTRLTAFNQTFAPVGKITKILKPLAAIWHDGVAGRKQEDIMSAYYNFLVRFRDVKKIHLWLDNCAAQNKNWLFFSMLIDLVNSDIIAAERITLYYFEPGHTFMSCDQFHHQVELAMKKKGKIYDFTDFEDAVASANNGKVYVKSLQPQDFINYANNISDRRIQYSNPRAYLNTMTEVCFKRTSFDLHYKNNFNDEYITLKFLNEKHLKNPQSAMTFRTLPKGIEQDRKLNIIAKLSPIIPKHKMAFWENMPISDDHEKIQTKKINKRKPN